MPGTQGWLSGHPPASERIGAGVSEPDRAVWEIERGLTLAQRAHFADAAAHFSIAREQLSDAQARVLVALDGFIDSHSRYWDAQQALHEATHRFVVASTDQEARFADLQEALTTAQGSIGAQNRQVPDPEPEAWPNPRDDPPAPADTEQTSALPTLAVTCFGRFEVRRHGELVEPCRNKNGQAILRYLAAHPRHRETVDALVEALWPSDAPEVARHKLHVAASALRGALNRGLPRSKRAGYLVFKNGGYELDPATIKCDADEFEALFSAGQRAGGEAAVSSFEAACRLYTGTFLAEDVYADWSFLRREALAQHHVTMCSALAAHELSVGHNAAAARWATVMLEEDRCNEAAYRQLMRAYALDGRRGEALRQYQRCQQVLEAELGVGPMPETTAVFYAVLKGEPPPAERAEIEGT